MEITYFAKCFGGLSIDVTVERDGAITDARFSSSGNSLPDSMWDRLIHSGDDLYYITQEAMEAWAEDY